MAEKHIIIFFLRNLQNTRGCVAEAIAMAEKHLIIFFLKNLQETRGCLAEAIALPKTPVPLHDG